MAALANAQLFQRLHMMFGADLLAPIGMIGAAVMKAFKTTYQKEGKISEESIQKLQNIFDKISEEENLSYEEMKELISDTKELHLMISSKGYNYLGPGTRLSQRVLGNDVTKLLPINKLDLIAMEHDFYYEFDDPEIRQIADKIFLKKTAPIAKKGNTDAIIAQFLIAMKEGVYDTSMEKNAITFLPSLYGKKARKGMTKQEEITEVIGIFSELEKFFADMGIEFTDKGIVSRNLDKNGEIILEDFDEKKIENIRSKYLNFLRKNIKMGDAQQIPASGAEEVPKPKKKPTHTKTINAAYKNVPANIRQELQKNLKIIEIPVIKAWINSARQNPSLSKEVQSVINVLEDKFKEYNKEVRSVLKKNAAEHIIIPHDDIIKTLERIQDRLPAYRETANAVINKKNEKERLKTRYEELKLKPVLDEKEKIEMSAFMKKKGGLLTPAVRKKIDEKLEASGTLPTERQRIEAAKKAHVSSQELDAIRGLTNPMTGKIDITPRLNQTTINKVAEDIREVKESNIIREIDRTSEKVDALISKAPDETKQFLGVVQNKLENMHNKLSDNEWVSPLDEAELEDITFNLREIGFEANALLNNPRADNETLRDTIIQMDRHVDKAGLKLFDATKRRDEVRQQDIFGGPDSFGEQVANQGGSSIGVDEDPVRPPQDAINQAVGAGEGNQGDGSGVNPGAYGEPNKEFKDPNEPKDNGLKNKAGEKFETVRVVPTIPAYAGQSQAAQAAPKGSSSLASIASASLPSGGGGASVGAAGVYGTSILPRDISPFIYDLGTDAIIDGPEQRQQNLEVASDWNWVPPEGNTEGGTRNKLVQMNLKYLSNRFKAGSLYVPAAPVREVLPPEACLGQRIRLEKSMDRYPELQNHLRFRGVSDIQHNQERKNIMPVATPGKRIFLSPVKEFGVTYEVERESNRNRNTYVNVVDGQRL